MTKPSDSDLLQLLARARKRIETSDGAFGTAGGVAYAEGFITLNAETHHYLPVTDHARKVVMGFGV